MPCTHAAPSLMLIKSYFSRRSADILLTTFTATDFSKMPSLKPMSVGTPQSISPELRLMSYVSQPPGVKVRSFEP